MTPPNDESLFAVGSIDGPHLQTGTKEYYQHRYGSPNAAPVLFFNTDIELIRISAFRDANVKRLKDKLDPGSPYRSEDAGPFLLRQGEDDWIFVARRVTVDSVSSQLHADARRKIIQTAFSIDVADSRVSSSNTFLLTLFKESFIREMPWWPGFVVIGETIPVRRQREQRDCLVNDYCENAVVCAVDVTRNPQTDEKIIIGYLPIGRDRGGAPCQATGDGMGVVQVTIDKASNLTSVKYTYTTGKNSHQSPSSVMHFDETKLMSELDPLGKVAVMILLAGIPKYYPVMCYCFFMHSVAMTEIGSHTGVSDKQHKLIQDFVLNKRLLDKDTEAVLLPILFYNVCFLRTDEERETNRLLLYNIFTAIDRVRRGF